MNIDWRWLSYEDLSKEDLYAILARRQEVFVIEQQCIYPDLDGIDPQAFHLLGWGEHQGERQLLAYLRCVLPGVKYPEISLGRVLSAPVARGSGIGRTLLEQGIQHAEKQFPDCAYASRPSCTWKSSIAASGLPAHLNLTTKMASRTLRCCGNSYVNFFCQNCAEPSISPSR